MNRNGKTVELFYECRDKKRENVVGDRDPRALGVFKSVPARRKFRKAVNDK